MPCRTPGQLVAIAKDLLDNGTAVVDVHRVARKLLADAQRLQPRRSRRRTVRRWLPPALEPEHRGLPEPIAAAGAGLAGTPPHAGAAAVGGGPA